MIEPHSQLSPVAAIFPGAPKDQGFLACAPTFKARIDFFVAATRSIEHQLVRREIVIEAREAINLTHLFG